MHFIRIPATDSTGSVQPVFAHSDTTPAIPRR